MLSLMIVDDELTTRTSLQQFVPWSDIGITSVVIAENGRAALKLAAERPPSILLTDVRMPKMDGINLARQVRQLYPDCRIVFLSAYSDKEYLKSAIQLSAVDYLEKPIDMPTVISLFSNIVNNLIDQRKTFEENAKLIQHVEENVHMLRQDLTMKLILHQAHLVKLQDQYHQDILRLSPSGSYQMLCARMNWHKKDMLTHHSVVRNELLLQLNHASNVSTLRYLCGFVNAQDLVIIINTDVYHNPTHRLQTFTAHLFNLLSKHTEDSYSFSIGLSHTSMNDHDFGELYNSALSMLQQQFYDGVNRVFYPPLKPTAHFKADKKIYLNFRKVLRSRSLEDVHAFVSNLTENISQARDADINKIKNIYFTLFRNLFEVTMKWDLFESEDDSTEAYIWQELKETMTLSELSKLLILNIETVLKNTDNKTTSTDKTGEILSHIENNYMNNQLSIQSIANHVHWSPTYLSTYFKKATGKTINEYITELRIDKAKELLLDRKNKLYEISEYLGYADANYFSTLFKKYVTLTPSEFRDKYAND